MEYKNVIAILGGFEPTEDETGRALVTDDLDVEFERKTDLTVNLPTTHRSWLKWLEDDLDGSETPIGVIVR